MGGGRSAVKAKLYAELVDERKACHVCAPTLMNTSRTEELGRIPDCDGLGGWSMWQGNLDAELLVVGQDFCDVETYVNNPSSSPWPGENVDTNVAVVELAKCAGYSIRPPKKGVSDDVLFFTNAVLCLKTRGKDDAASKPKSKKDAKVPEPCLRKCGTRFLRRTIEIVRPVAVAALGVAALDAILWAHDCERDAGLVALIEREITFPLPCGARVFPLCHPGPKGRISRRSEEQRADWRRMGRWIASEAGKAE